MSDVWDPSEGTIGPAVSLVLVTLLLAVALVKVVQWIGEVML